MDTKKIIVLITLVILFLSLIIVAKNTKKFESKVIDYNYEYVSNNKENQNEDEYLIYSLYNKYSISHNTDSLDYYLGFSNFSDELVSYLLIKNLDKKDNYSFDEVENKIKELFNKEDLKEKYEANINDFKFSLIYSDSLEKYELTKEPIINNVVGYTGKIIDYKINKDSIDITEEYSFTKDNIKYNGKIIMKFVKNDDKYILNSVQKA